MRRSSSSHRCPSPRCRIRHVSTAPGVTESEYLYPLQDVAGNTVALVDDSGVVKERYLFDPQGLVTYLTPAFEAKPGTSYDWSYLLYGMRLDAATGLHFTGGGGRPRIGLAAEAASPPWTNA